MRDKIYTIPVTEAFNIDCECSICKLEDNLSEQYVTYILGPSLMEPDKRQETNKLGFCGKHFEMLNNSKINVLGLGLILETHLSYQNKIFAELLSNKPDINKDKSSSLFQSFKTKISPKNNELNSSVDDIIFKVDSLIKSCTICEKINSTLERYIEVILYLWKEEPDFKKVFNSKKGFCLKHFKRILLSTKKYYSSKEASDFLNILIPMEIDNLKRLEDEVSWFCKKFDYRNNDAPWKNSKDSVSRSIQKLSGSLDLK